MTMADLALFTRHVLLGDAVAARHCLAADEFVETIVDDNEAYRPIHIAARRGYTDMALWLVRDQHCDIEAQSSGEFKPIHLACKEGHLEVARLLIDNKCNIESETEEEYRPIHWACLNGHFQIAQLLIESKCCIESETYEKHRPIHLACIKGQLDIARLLIDHRCNIESESFNKHRPIHLACVNGHLDIVKLLIEYRCNIESIASIMKYRSIHLACVNGHVEISRFLIECNCNIESESFNKYRPIHLACEIGNYDIVKLLINHQCNIDCETINKYRPIHLASMKGHLDIVKLLVESKCQSQCETQNGCLAQDLAERAGHMSIVEFLNAIENAKKIFHCLQREDSTRLDKLSSYLGINPLEEFIDLSVLQSAVQNTGDGIVKYVLERTIDDEEISELAKAIDSVQNINTVDRLWQECLFYRCIRDHHQAGFQLLCSPSIINSQRDIVTSSFLELAAEYGTYAFINDILHKSIYDSETWDRAKNQALKKGYHQIFVAISNRESLLKSREKARLSILHTAICDNDPDMVKYIMDNDLVDPNCNNQTVGTSLALAHILCHKQCITVLEQYCVDPNTRNQFLQTPLHEAIASGMNEHCTYLIDQACDIDKTGFMGLTALHLAVLHGCDDVCQQLVKKGADCTRYIELPREFMLDRTEFKGLKSRVSFSNRENCLTLCLKMYGTLYPCFLEILDEDKANCCDGAGNSLLHLAVETLEPEVCRALVTSKAIVDGVNAQGNTCLLELLCSVDQEACYDRIIDIAHLLIESGADINRTTTEGITIFQMASKFHNERLMLALVGTSPSLACITELDFQLALTEHWFDYATVLLERMPPDLVSASITSELVLLILPYANSTLLSSLFERATNDVKQSTVEDMLYHASSVEDDDLFQCLINTEISSPKLFDNGETLLTNLIMENKVKFCLNLFQSKNKNNFVNLKNGKQQIPLQIAIDIGSLDMVDHLVFESDQLDNEDENGDTALGLLFRKLSAVNDANAEMKLLSTIKSIISRGGNIYTITSQQQQVIDACPPSPVRTDIELFHKTERDKLEKTSSDRGVIGGENVVVEKVVEVEKICNVCIERVVNCVIECGHTFCMDCGHGFVQCPFCKFEPTNPKRIFFN